MAERRYEDPEDKVFGDWIVMRGEYIDHGYRYYYILRPYSDMTCKFCEKVIPAGCYAEVRFAWSMAPSWGEKAFSERRKLRVKWITCLTNPTCGFRTPFYNSIKKDMALACTSESACWAQHLTSGICY